MKTKLATICFGVAAALSLASVQAGDSSDEKVRFAGTVRDSAGSPIAGAAVELFQSEQNFRLGTEPAKADKRIVTGPDGTYEFQAPGTRTWLFVSKPGLAPAWAYYWQPTGDVDEQLLLSPPSSICGVVVDEADRPVVGASVWLRTGYSEQSRDGSRTSHYLPRMPHKDAFSATTGPDGKFEIRGCPTNAAFDFGLRAPGKSLRLVSRQYVGPDTMHWRPGQKEVKLVVDAAGSVEGKVRSRQTGEPLGNVRVVLAPGRGGGMWAEGPTAALSETNGSFRITEVAPGAYRAQASFGTNAVSDFVAEYVSLNVEAGRTTRDIEIEAVKPGFLQITVQAKEDSRPTSDVNVAAVSQTFVAGSITGRDGIALLALPAGTYQVTGNKDSAQVSGGSVEVVSGRTNGIELVMEPPRRITGVVLDPTGQPVSGLQLRVLPEYRVNTGIIKTDPEGKFSFPWKQRQFGGPDATCCIVARDIKRNLALTQDLDDESKSLELRLQPGFSVAGRVEDAAGAPLTNATLQLFCWVGNMGSQFDSKPVQGDAHGRFAVQALPAGRRFSMSATAKGYGSQSQQIQSEDGQTNAIELDPFVLSVADRKLAGKVVDAEDKPVGQAYVHMYGQGQPNASVRTDEKGCFSFEEVCEGQVRLSASTQGSYGNASAEAGDTNVLLKLGVNADSFRQAPRRLSLKGKPLPDLTGLGLAKNCAPAGKAVLLCLVDIEQRPGRRLLRLLAEQQDALRQRGLTIVALQTVVTTPETLEQWKAENPVTFDFGQVSEKRPNTKWASDAESLPWLILADKDHRVRDEGFPFEDLDAKLKEVLRPEAR